MRKLAVCSLISLLLAASGCALIDRLGAVPPTVALSAEPRIGATPLSVRFEASEVAGGSPIVEYAWDFGDGTAPVSHGSPQVEHTYTRPGTFAARLIVTDSNDSTGAAELTIEASNTPPIAACRLSNDAPVPGERVQYDGSGSIDLDGTLIDFVWDFGDGDTMRGTRVSHVYDETGIYTVRLTVEDDSGDTASVTHDIDVHRAVSRGGGCGGAAAVGLF